MLLKLLALFTIVPLVELALLVVVAQYISLWPTIALVIATAVLGAVLGKLEGKRAWAKIKEDLKSGTMPRDSLLDGLAVLIAGAFLITPGVLTDVAAMVLLIPVARAPLKNLARKRFKKMLDSGQVSFVSSGSFSLFDGGQNGGQGARPYRQSPFESREDDDVIDVTPGDDEEPDATQSESRARRDHLGD